MTKVIITQENRGAPGAQFRASARNRQCVGATPGAALDALTNQLSDEETGTLIVQRMNPDTFFTADQKKRLGELMAKWRAARDRGCELTPIEQSELETLVDAELEASGRRADAIASELLP